MLRCLGDTMQRARRNGERCRDGVTMSHHAQSTKEKNGTDGTVIYHNFVVGFTFLCFRNFRASYNLSKAIVFTSLPS